MTATRTDKHRAVCEAGKKALQVDTARAIARAMVAAESRGAGDTAGAMRRLAARHGLTFTFFWSLRYRPPKDLLLSAWTGLLAAYEAECERQAARLAAEAELARTLKDAADADRLRPAGLKALAPAPRRRPR